MSTIAPDYFYGWDLLFRTIQKEVNNKDDLLVALVHFVLTKHSQFRCIGLGDDKTLSEDETKSGSELLPDNWNAEDHNYALRYVNNKQLFLLLALRVEDSFIVTLLETKDRKVSNIALDPEDMVKCMKGSIREMMPKACELTKRFTNELLGPICTARSCTAATQTFVSCMPSTLPLNIPLPSVSFGDLDPFAGGVPDSLFAFPTMLRPRINSFATPYHIMRPNPDLLLPPGFVDDNYFSM